MEKEHTHEHQANTHHSDEVRKAIAIRVALWLPVIEEDSWKYARADRALQDYNNQR